MRLAVLGSLMLLCSATVISACIDDGDDFDDVLNIDSVDTGIVVDRDFTFEAVNGVEFIAAELAHTFGGDLRRLLASGMRL